MKDSNGRDLLAQDMLRCGIPDQPIPRFVVSPLLPIDIARRMKAITREIDLIATEKWETIITGEQQLRLSQRRRSLGTYAMRDGLDDLVRGLYSTIKIYIQSKCDRRAAATALAIRMYKLDHGGRPTTLSELVPRYIPVLPGDPFATTPRPLGYLPNANPPMLYSVGENGVDDFAVADWRAAHPGYEHVVWQATVKEMQPEKLFSFTWHPYGIDKVPASRRAEAFRMNS